MVKKFQKRIISRLDIKGSRLIKGIRFEGLRVIGNPCDFAENYFKEGIDEIFYTDAVASLYGRNSLDNILKETCESIFVPITAGGAISSIDDAYLLLRAGADKIAINTNAVKNPDLITKLANRFGQQCIVLSIQARRSLKMTSGWEIMIEAGRELTGIDLQDWIEKAQKLGIGEIFLTSVDQDGANKGPDRELINLANKIVTKPLIVGGGFNSLTSIKDALSFESVSGVAIGYALHYDKIKLSEIKQKINCENIRLRNEVSSKSSINKTRVCRQIAVVEYGMGNQQSLINALNLLGHEVVITDSNNILKDSEIVILPGVGSFPAGINELEKRGLKEVLLERHQNNKALVGICLGMQLLFEESEEFEKKYGLGIFKGKVKNLKAHKVYDDQEKENISSIKLPHVGWNSLNHDFGNSSFIDKKDIKNKFFYFVHSFGVEEVINADFVFSTNYYFRNPVAICGLKRTVGYQFHPERSGQAGLSILSKTIDNVI